MCIHVLGGACVPQPKCMWRSEDKFEGVDFTSAFMWTYGSNAGLEFAQQAFPRAISPALN